MKLLKKTIVNHVLSQNDWMKTKLKGFEGKSIAINISNVIVNFIIKDGGQIFLIDNCDKPDSIIEMSFETLISQITNKKIADISIQGDIELAKEVTDVLKKIKWDIEEDLSQVIGDVPATELAKIGRKILKETKTNLISIGDTFKEYWQEENPILAKKRHIEKFLSEVDLIAEDVDRVEAKIEVLQRHLIK